MQSKEKADVTMGGGWVGEGMRVGGGGVTTMREREAGKDISCRTQSTQMVRKEQERRAAAVVST